MISKFYSLRFWMILGCFFVILVACKRRAPAIGDFQPQPTVGIIVEEIKTATPTSATAVIVPTEVAVTTKTTTPTADLPLPTVTSSLQAPAQPDAATSVSEAPTAATPSATAVLPTIYEFKVASVEDTYNGKHIVFEWLASGGMRACISETGSRFPRWWMVPSNGSFSVGLEGTVYRDPDYTLQIFPKDGHCIIGGQEPPAATEQHATASLTVEWACENAYFFSPSPRRCPLDVASTRSSAEQSFENGFMLWVAGDEAKGEPAYIYVFFNDGHVEQYVDSWISAEVESDPSLTPPADKIQPIRGFGKVWRTQSDMKERIGWALAVEHGYIGTQQAENHEGSAAGEPMYLKTFDGRVIRLGMLSFGSWEYVSAE